MENAKPVFMAWAEELELGIPTVDIQHRYLVLLLNALHEAYIEDDHNERINEIVDELISYSYYHFKTEEDLFEKYNYAFKTFHVKEHEAFTQDVLDFKSKARVDVGKMTFSLMVYLRKWLNDHIKGSDKRYAIIVTGADRLMD